MIDQPSPVRPNETLNIPRLAAYLQAHLPNLHGDLTIQQFRGGYSNLTYALTFGDTEMVLRRPPFGAKIKSAHDMGREYRILSKLHPAGVPVPQPLLNCDDDAVIGAPFYIMQRVKGVILRPQLRPSDAPAPEQMAAIASALVDQLVRLHALDLDAAGLADFGRPTGYVTRQVNGWQKRWHRALTDPVPDMETVADWLKTHQPPSPAPTLLHNDFKYDNMVLHPDNLTHIRAILDWEMATVGDPLMDLGMMLAYWVEKGDSPVLQAVALSPTALPGNPTRAQIAAMYAASSGRNLQHLTFYYVFGLFKLAVIAQQIYQRWKLGHTQDSRFAALLAAVQALAHTATRAIRRNAL